METEVRLEITFFVSGNIKREHVIEWAKFQTGQTGIISGSNPMQNIEFNEIADMEEFLLKVQEPR